MDSDALREAMTLALGGLPDRARRADELRIVEELGYAEIAPRLGCTDGAARTSGASRAGAAESADGDAGMS